MVTTLEQLVSVGLTQGEAKVYLALLELGSSTVGPIVKKSKVAYSNIYEILQRLGEKGLITFIIRNKTKYFQPADPEFLKDFLKKKEIEIKTNQKVAESLIPKIRKIQKQKPEQEAEIYIGFAGLKAAFMKALQGFEGEILWFYREDPEYLKDVETSFMNILQSIRKTNVKTKGLVNELYKKSKLYGRYTSLQQIRIVDFPIPGNMDIIGDYIIIASYKKPFTTFLIKSPSVAEDMRKYFYFVWEKAKK